MPARQQLGLASTVALGLLTGAALARRPTPPLCQDARYLLEVPVAIGEAPAPAEMVVVTGRQVALPGACAAAVAGKVTGTRRGTKVRAKWTGCPGVRGKVLLKALVEPACERMAGQLRARRERLRKTFDASRSRCGDGQVDEGAGEECEMPGTPVCDAACRRITPPSTTTTMASTTTTTLPAGLAIAITSPTNLAVLGQSSVAVAGTVSAAVSVACNGVTAQLAADGFTAPVALHEGNNTIACVARDAEDHVATASVTVTIDTTPPHLTIQCPKDGAQLTSALVAVAGMVNDVVVGTVNGEQASVVCNGIAADVANRTFLATELVLVPGANEIACTATDRAGNSAFASVVVTVAAASGAMLRLVSGNNQNGTIGSVLTAPLVVELEDAGGGPIANKKVVFRVIQNDGTLGAGAAPALVLETGADGRAQTTFRLGTRAGAGNHQVSAAAVGVTGNVVFTASADPAGPARIVVDSGLMQQGAAGQALPRPFVAALIDAGNNRLAGVPVTFTAVEGGGGFGGLPAVTVDTDGDGRALAVLTLGPADGLDNNRVEATFAGNPGPPAVFVASGKVAGDPAATRLSGAVLDNSNLPIPGVTLRLEGTALVVQSDAEGQFVIQPAPVGHVHLHVDASTATRPGPWPNLAYELVTVAGQDNGIGMPIYLPKENVLEGLFIDETHGGTLTLAAVPGFALEVAPGSATFPGGSHSGTVTVTSVHPDKVPMVPNFGMQPRFIVSIQPAGTLFDPPAAMTLPNDSGLPPGQKTEMYSFDHDLGQFVSIGTGTVSTDGSVVRSDPGVGILKGGWHCGGNPGGTGTCKHECDDGEDCTTDKLVGGSCTHTRKDDGTLCKPAPDTFECGGGKIGIVGCGSPPQTPARCEFGKCVEPPRPNRGPTHREVWDGLRALCDGICNPNGCSGAVGTAMKNKLMGKQLRVICLDTGGCYGEEDCACAPRDAPTDVLLGANTPTCGGNPNITATVLRHEMQHRLLGQYHTGPCSTDPIYGCDKACNFPGADTRCGGTVNAASCKP